MKGGLRLQPRTKLTVVVLASLVAIFALLGGCGGSSAPGSSFLSGASSASPPTDTSTASPAGTSAVLVGYKNLPTATDEGNVTTRHRGHVKHRFTVAPVIAADVPTAEVAALKADPNVAYVEPDAVACAQDDSLPWGVPKIQACSVWGGTQTAASIVAGRLSGNGVKVAVLDTGVDYTHPDLKANYKGGWNFIKNTSDPKDDNGHGTHVAGIVCAADDGLNVIGVAPKVSHYAVKVLDNTAYGLWSTIIAGIQWAVNNHMQVINMSIGGSASASMKAACDAAYAKGVVIVAAAGNSGSAVMCPAMYSESVIAVAATDSSNNRCSWSCYGPTVEISAPGNGITSDKMGGGTISMSGTSMASPHVAGVCALIIESGVTSPAAIRARLNSTATDRGTTGFDTYYGYGVVNALAAVGGITQLATR